MQTLVYIGCACTYCTYFDHISVFSVCTLCYCVKYVQILATIYVHLLFACEDQTKTNGGPLVNTLALQMKEMCQVVRYVVTILCTGR